MKIIRTGGRGTTRRVTEKEEDNWAGPGFVEYSKQQKDVANPSDEKGEEQEQKQLVSQEDQDADLWLNQLSNDPKTFLKNKFYIESKKNAATRGVDPW